MGEPCLDIMNTRERIADIIKRYNDAQLRITALAILGEDPSQNQELIRATVKAETFRKEGNYHGAELWYYDAELPIEADAMRLLRSTDETVVLKQFIRPGMTVCEFFIGHSANLVEAASELVGPKGVVYAIDELPFELLFEKHLPTIKSRGNIVLLQQRVPPLPIQLKVVDVFMVREFLWAYKEDEDGVHQFPEQLWNEMLARLPKGGIIILFVGDTAIGSGYVKGPFKILINKPRLVVVQKN